MKPTQSLRNKSPKKPIRRIVALSGGKDSTALAIYLRKKIPNLEYVFCDSGEELPETYDYLYKLQDYLSISVTWLKTERNFQYYLDMYKGVLPDSNTRWCTRVLKIEPFEKYVGDDQIINYVGIRADELHRQGYISKKSNIKTEFPFIENQIRLDGVLRILKEEGLGLPEYYRWRSRSGCFFCFYQQKREWVGLLENHRELYSQAEAFEKNDPEAGTKYTWMEKESLESIRKDPERIAKIKADYEKRKIRLKNQFKDNQKLTDLWTDEGVNQKLRFPQTL
jgi:3'-phosphoadenosine 5'-phosphosulfate sulfotransferase (PAPS reductase)/FAD synthetase